MYSTERLKGAVASCSSVLAAEGLLPRAKVWDSARAMDVALVTGRCEALVIRCVETAIPEDYRALKTMLHDGDFDKAILVQCEKTQEPPPPSGIDTCSLDELPQVLASLVRGGLAS